MHGEQGISSRDGDRAWERLSELRRQGKFPKLVIVTDQPKMPLRGTGDLVIDHVAGSPMPVQHLDGLDVIFWFDTCQAAAKARLLASERGVKFERVRCYCKCACAINVCTYDCQTIPAIFDWLTGVA